MCRSTQRSVLLSPTEFDRKCKVGNGKKMDREMTHHPHTLHTLHNHSHNPTLSARAMWTSQTPQSHWRDGTPSPHRGPISALPTQVVPPRQRKRWPGRCARLGLGLGLSRRAWLRRRFASTRQVCSLLEVCGGCCIAKLCCTW